MNVMVCKETKDHGAQNADQKNEGQLLLKKLPLLNITDIEAMEILLLEEDNFNGLAKELSLIGGDSVKEITNRILHHTLSISVGTQYSWEGFKGKKNFKNLKLAALIIKSIRFNKKTENATEAEIVKFFKAWLVRCKGKEDRQSRKGSQPSDAVPS